MNKKLLSFLLIIFLNGCSGKETSLPDDYIPSWTTPAPPHTLILSGPIFSKMVWDRQFYVLSSSFKDVQCTSSEGMVTLIGSPDSANKPMTFTLSGSDGSLLWSIDSAGSLAISKYGLFIGDGTMAYLVDTQAGQIKWKKQIPGADNITSVMYSNDLFFVDAKGVYTYFVLSKDGQVISKYLQASDFHSVYKDIYFFPDLPFGYAIGQNIYIEHRGNALYSGYVHDISSHELLWERQRASISNFLIFNSYVLWISPEDKIKIADQISGEILETITITPSIDCFDNDANKQTAGYYLCGDTISGLVYVILGDSHQIFAIKATN